MSLGLGPSGGAQAMLPGGAQAMLPGDVPGRFRTPARVGVEVRGGAGGMGARLEDLERAGVLLCSLGADLAGLGRSVAAVAVDPGLVASGLLAPLSWAQAEAELSACVVGPAGPLALAARVEAIGAAVFATATGYRRAEAAISAELRVLEPAELAAGTGLAAGLIDGLLGRRWLQESTGVQAQARPVPPGWGGQTGRGGPGGVLPTGVVAPGACLPPNARARRPLQALASWIPVAVAQAPTIHVERRDGADGVRRWSVAIPGTATWSAVPGASPFDLTGDVRLMAGQRSAGMAGVVAALRLAGARRGEPVLLVGHSQGGLIAAALAADPQVRREFTITHVLSLGAPIAAIRVPAQVQVLAIEHAGDPVPGLDARANPDRPNWITITAPAPSGPSAPAASGAPGAPSALPGPLKAHGLDRYQLTAADLDRLPDQSLARWRDAATPFLDGSRAARAWDVEISRTGAP